MKKCYILSRSRANRLRRSRPCSFAWACGLRTSKQSLLDGFTEKRLNILLREMKAYGVSVPYKAMVTEHNIGWTLSDLFTELVREHEAMHQ